MDNPDSNGQILMSMNEANKMGMTSFGSDVYGPPKSTATLTFTGTGNCSALAAA